MKSTYNKHSTNQKTSNSQDVCPTLITNNKVKTKRKITNPFKRLSSLRRSKSHTISNSSKSDSEIAIKEETIEFDKLLANAKYISKYYDENNINYNFSYDLPTYSHSFLTSAVQSTNVPIENFYYRFPSLEELRIQNENTDSIEKKENYLIFNTGDLPSVSRSDINDEESLQSPHSKRLDENLIVNENKNTMNGKQFNKDNRHSKILTRDNIGNTIIPTNFIPETNSTLNLPLSLGLKEVLDLAVMLQESESNIKHIISKYIRNENLQKELLQAMNSHAKIQIENERRNYKLTKDLFSQEIELLKAREKSLQNSLDVAVYANRLLEEEIEELKTENEKVFIEYDKNSISYENHKQHLEELLKNNNAIRTKYKKLLGEIRRLENELRSMEHQNQCLIGQIANGNSQIRNYRDMLHRVIGDHEIEQIALSHELTVNEQNIKDCVDAGDTLLEDLETIKNQLKPFSLSINWTKFKNNGSSIVDLIHLSRNLLNELTRQLISIYNQINNTNKDRDKQTLEINKLTEELSKIKYNDEELQSKIETLTSNETKVQLQNQKINILKTELSLLKNENSILIDSLQKQKHEASKQEKNIDDLNIQIASKDLVISNLNMNICDYQTELRAIKFQLHSMQNLLDKNQLSNVLKELMEAKEKLVYYESLNYQMELDRQNVAEQSKKIDNEKETLMIYQKSFYEHFQAQQNDIKELNQQNDNLKAKLLEEHKKLCEKSAQLTKQNEAVDLMKTLQSQFQVEFSKNLSLEATALNNNYELNRLSVVADYNNEVCKQLKGLITAKDKTITELNTALENLNIKEKKNLEEKASLCNELTEASYIIKQLKNDLAKEKENIQQINAAKELTEKNTDLKIQDLHKMLMDERQALRELLNNYENITSQKNDLMVEQKNLQNKIENFKLNEDKLKKNNEKIEAKYKKLEEEYTTLLKQLENVNNLLEMEENKTKNCIVDYENEITTRDSIIREIKCKNEELQNSIEYLQCNIKKLHSDVNELRSAEKSYIDKINNNNETITKYQRVIEEQNWVLNECRRKIQIFEDKSEQKESEYASLSKEFTDYVHQHESIKEKLEKQLDEYKKLNKTKTINIEILAKASEENLKQIDQRELEINKLKAEILKLEDIKKEFYEKTKLLEQAILKQRKLDEKIENKKDKCIEKVNKLKDLLTDLKLKYENSLKQREDDATQWRNMTEELKNEYDKTKQIMKNDLDKLGKEILALKSKYDEKCTTFNELHLEYKDLAESMTKALNLLVKEKVAKHNMEIEIESLKQQIVELSNNEVKIENNIIPEDINKLKIDLKELKIILITAKDNIKSLEKQVMETNNKLHELNKTAFTQETNMISELDKRSNLLKEANEHIFNLEDSHRKLKQHIKVGNKVILALKTEISLLNQKLEISEFQKYELTVRYHELKGKFQTEQNLNITLKDCQCRHLSTNNETHSSNSAPSISESLMLTFK